MLLVDHRAFAAAERAATPPVQVATDTDHRRVVEAVVSGLLA
jgi:hypothetical protein